MSSWVRCHAEPDKASPAVDGGGRVGRGEPSYARVRTTSRPLPPAFSRSCFVSLLASGPPGPTPRIWPQRRWPGPSPRGGACTRFPSGKAGSSARPPTLLATRPASELAASTGASGGEIRAGDPVLGTGLASMPGFEQASADRMDLTRALRAPVPAATAGRGPALPRRPDRQRDRSSDASVTGHRQEAPQPGAQPAAPATRGVTGGPAR